MLHVVEILETELHALIHALHLDGHISAEVAAETKVQASTILKAAEPLIAEAAAVGAQAAQTDLSEAVGGVGGEVLGQVAAGAVASVGSAVLVEAESAVEPAPVESVAPDAPAE